jgi:hypothetical protein
MTTPAVAHNIPESFLEHRQTFGTAWVDRWTIGNPFITLLHPAMLTFGVELSDFSFNKEAANVGDTYLNIAVKRLNSAIRVGLDHVTYIAANPDWGMAPQLVELFDGVSAAVQSFLGQVPKSQKLTLAFHVAVGELDLHQETSKLVNRSLLGEADFYGVSMYHEYGSTVIDKSLRYDRAAFIRMQRRFDGHVSFAEIAPIIYDEEVKTLALIGVTGVV